jgi:DNA polymerase-3 subunit beta
MKFSLDKDTFSRVLKRIDGVCNGRGSFAILSSCMIEARDNSIIVTGTDLDITLRVVENAHVIEEGRIAINARRLLDTVQNQPANVEILVANEGSQILVSAGNFKARIPSSDINEYPKIESLSVRSSVTLDAAIFKRLINKTMFSISNDESRADFMGALLTIHENGKIQMVSTDGHRLSRAEDSISITGEINSNFNEGVIIRRKGLVELDKNIEGGEISIDIASNKFVVTSSSTTFYINLIAGRFPDFSKVIPSMLDHKAVIRRDDFQQILKRASIFTNKTTGTIRLSLSHGRIDVSTYDSKSGEMNDFIEADYEGTGVVAGFNWKYIMDILNVIDNDYVSFEIIDMDSPAVLRDVSTQTLDFIVMPMQL